MANIKILDKSFKSDNIIKKIGDGEGLYYVTYIDGKAVSTKIDIAHFEMFMENNELVPAIIAVRIIKELVNEGLFLPQGQSIYIVYRSDLFTAFLVCDSADKFRFIDSANLKTIKKSFGFVV